MPRFQAFSQDNIFWNTNPNEGLIDENYCWAVVITDAGSGIGRIAAIRFAELGINVAVVDINNAENPNSLPSEY